MQSNKTVIKAAALIAVTNMMCTAIMGCHLNNTIKHISNYSDDEMRYITPETTEVITLSCPVLDIDPTFRDSSVTYELPNLDTSFKTYMDYRYITDTDSMQYKLQQNSWTDEDGLRRLGEAYMVAMGTYYADECGKTFEITFDTGEKILVVVGDIKADCHTDKTNRYSPVYDNNGNFISANVLEFIVDTKAMSRHTKRLGTVEYCGNLQGNIVSIVAIEEGVQEI